jgi:hypothetical protein
VEDTTAAPVETPVPRGAEDEAIPAAVDTGRAGVVEATAETPVPRGADTVEAEPGVDTTPPADAVADVYAAMMAELADSASKTGQTVVVSWITSVTMISLVDSDARAGQLVMLAAHDVIV